MRFYSSVLVLVAIVGAVVDALDDCPESCTDYEWPVCGSDGKTYRNKCTLGKSACQNKNGVVLRHYGPCQNSCSEVKCQFGAFCEEMNNGTAECVCPRFCPRIYRPVCGTDGETYPNECALRVKNCERKKSVQVMHTGECKSRKESCVNVKCEFGAKCREVNNGTAKCVCPNFFPLIYRPVCGTDGETYPNEYVLVGRNCKAKKFVQVAYEGKCKSGRGCSNVRCKFGAQCVDMTNGTAECVCQKGCPPVLDPVCGTDGETYDNECVLNNMNCHEGKRIHVVHRGECKGPKGACSKVKCDFGANCIEKRNGTTECVCHFGCSHLLDPVCGTDGETYPNGCVLRAKNCERKKSVQVMRRGACKSREPCANVKCEFGARCVEMNNGTVECACPRFCPLYYKPVCGTDGKTYDNECELTRDNCRAKKHVKVDYFRKCGPKGPCRNVYCTFGSRCIEMDNSTFKCSCINDCPRGGNPVCGTDGRTYANSCSMNVASCERNDNIYLAYYGECKSCMNAKCMYNADCIEVAPGAAKCVCPVCSHKEDPVCGTDHVTYDNECKLREANCKNKLEVNVAHKGKCRPTSCIGMDCGLAECQVVDGIAGCHCPSIYPEKYEPVCGSDGKNYDSERWLRRISCEEKSDIWKVHNGKCRASCQDAKCEFGAKCFLSTEDDTASCGCGVCLLIHRPVCGTDGKSYPNACELRRRNCLLKKNVQLAYTGGCKLCENVSCKHGSDCQEMSDGTTKCVCPECDDEIDPLCGSDGKTYGNFCLLQRAICQRQGQIMITSQGVCPNNAASNTTGIIRPMI